MIFSAIERKIAFRYLRARRAESFISVISGFSIAGIALGVATLIVVTSVMNGVRDEMLAHIIGWNGHVNVYGNGSIDDYDAVAAKILATEGAVSATPMVEGQVMVSAGGQASGAMVSAIRYNDFEKRTHVTSKITAGSLEAFRNGEGIIIGERMAENLGVGVGGSITLISPQGRQTIAGLVPRIKAYTVVATFKFGMYAYDAGQILMPFDEAQTFFKLNDNGADRVSGIEVMTTSYDEAPLVAQKVYETLQGQYRVYDWMATNKQIFDALEIQRNVMFLILALIVVVAAFNIISSLIMLVKDKGQDIAILRTMGASQGVVMRVFLMCGTSIGAIGTLVGLALGLLLAYNVENIRLWIEQITGKALLGEQLYFLSTLPSKVDLGEVGSVVVMALALSFLATLYPARRAASIDPAEGLRYE